MKEQTQTQDTPIDGYLAVNGSYSSLLFEGINLKSISIDFFIGVDTCDKDNLAYCFAKKSDGITEILLAKTMSDEKKFKEEVENLSKYFNATVYGEI